MGGNVVPRGGRLDNGTAKKKRKKKASVFSYKSSESRQRGLRLAGVPRLAKREGGERKPVPKRVVSTEKKGGSHSSRKYRERRELLFVRRKEKRNREHRRTEKKIVVRIKGYKVMATWGGKRGPKEFLIWRGVGGGGRRILSGSVCLVRKKEKPARACRAGRDPNLEKKGTRLKQGRQEATTRALGGNDGFLEREKFRCARRRKGRARKASKSAAKRKKGEKIGAATKRHPTHS